MYYKIRINKTATPLFKNYDHSYCYDDFSKNFQTLKDLQKWLQDEYHYITSKPQPIYRDTPQDSKQVGFIYSFRNDYDKINEQHWIEITKVHEETILIKQ